MSDFTYIIDNYSLSIEEKISLSKQMNYIPLPYAICECGGYIWASIREDLPEIKGL
jgi:hypothetical protein